MIAAEDLAQIIAAVQAAAGPAPAGEGFPLNLASLFRAGNTIINGSGLFVYSSAPAFGNLIASLTSSPGTDTFGNAYLADVTGYYTGAGRSATQLGTLNQLAFWTAPGAGGPWSNVGTIGGGSADVILASNRDIMHQQPVGMLDQAAPTAISGRARMYASTGGWVRYLADSAGDGNSYATGTARYWLTSGQLVNSTTPVSLTFQQPASTVNIPVAAGTYFLHGQIYVLQGSAGPGNQAIRINGPATSLVDVGFACIEGASVFNSGVYTALGGNMSTGAIPLNSTGELKFDGPVTFSAAGNLSFQVLCVTASADTWTVGAGSYLELCPAG